MYGEENCYGVSYGEQHGSVSECVRSFGDGAVTQGGAFCEVLLSGTFCRGWGRGFLHQ